MKEIINNHHYWPKNMITIELCVKLHRHIPIYEYLQLFEKIVID